MHPRDLAQSAALLGKAQEPRDPMEGFADEAENRLDQDLMLLTSGHRNRFLLRRMKQFKDFIVNPAAASTEFAQKYKQRVLEALATPVGRMTYVPGSAIGGDDLRKFSEVPIMSGPLVCQLCDTDFLTERSFAEHKNHAHAGESEYRKRVLYLMSQQGCRPITGQEKRIIVQNFAHFQQFCHPGSKGNYFADSEEVPRYEAACALCARKDFLEHRHKLNLFAEPPTNTISETPAVRDAQTEQSEEEDPSVVKPSTRALLKYRGIYYIQTPDQVHKLLDVTRYAQRWPLIPIEELHASSIQHPANPEWRWLLHTRRVPVRNDHSIEGPCAHGAHQPVGALPACAGIGDPSVPVWACWDCLSDVCCKNPKMPLNGAFGRNPWRPSFQFVVSLRDLLQGNMFSVGLLNLPATMCVENIVVVGGVVCAQVLLSLPVVPSDMCITPSTWPADLSVSWLVCMRASDLSVLFC